MTLHKTKDKRTMTDKYRVTRIEDKIDKLADNVIVLKDDLTNQYQDIKTQLVNHLEHHKFLEQQNSLKRDWIKWGVPVILTVANLIMIIINFKGGA